MMAEHPAPTEQRSATTGDRPPELQASRLGWAVSGRFILLDLDLTVHPGELLVISGHNGCGKTSLLGLLHGDFAPSRGLITLGGVPLDEVATDYIARQIATLEHRPGLYFDLTGLENVQLFAELVGQRLSATQAAAVLSEVGLPAEAQSRRVRHYSRGMQQRAGLARVLASAAPIWLLDEPSTGLDADGRATLTQVLKTAVRNNKAVLAISHDPGLIASADRHLVLRDGSLHNSSLREVA